jgi:hypothetical protein
MTSLDKKQLLAKFNGNPPTNRSAISKFEFESRVKLPDDFALFLQQMNGGDGFIGDAYVILWPVQELLEKNQAYEVADSAPGLLLFGSDGGGEAFAFDTRSLEMPIVAVPFIGMEMEAALPIAPNFNSFLEALYKS